MASKPKSRGTNRAKTATAASAVEPPKATTEVIDDSLPQSEDVEAVDSVKEDEPSEPAVPTTDRSGENNPFQIDRAAAAAATRRLAAERRSNQLAIEMEKVASASENPSLDKALGIATNLPEPTPERPAIFDMIDRTIQPFIEEMSPNAYVADTRAGELHYSMSTLIKYLLNVGGNEMKVGVPYLLSYYRKYKGGVFHPQYHHRGVGAMRGSDADIDFYRNMSRLLVDISHPDEASLVLQRTDIQRFRKLTMAITSPAAQKMSENLMTLISRVHAR